VISTNARIKCDGTFWRLGGGGDYIFKRFLCLNQW
jgi:hypothetical protein